MRGGEHLRWYVLSAVAPLYENVSGIGLKVKTWSEQDGFSFSEAEIRNTLDDLIASGLVDSWTLAASSPENRRTTYHPNEVEKLWFLISARGQQLLASIDKKLRGGNAGTGNAGTDGTFTDVSGTQ